MARYSATFVKEGPDGGKVVHICDLSATNLQEAINEAQSVAAPDFFGASAIDIFLDGSKVERVGVGANAYRT